MDDYGALIASGQNLVPDLQRQLLQRAQAAALGAQVRESDAQVAALNQKQVRAQQFQQDLASSDGSPSAVSRLIMKYPEFADQLKSGYDVQDNAAKQADLTATGEIYSAATSGNWALAKKLAHQRADAEREAGRTNPAYDSALEAMDQAADGDETQRKAVLNLLGTHLAAVTGPEQFARAYSALNDKQAGYTLGPGMRRYDANGNLVAEAPFAPQYRTVGEGESLVEVGGGGGTGGATSAGGFDNAVDFVLDHEGGYAPSDRNGSPVNFGINQGANPDINVKGLTRDQARQLYLDRYWKPSGAENLPAAMQTPYFDTYVLNPGMAKKLLDRSGGDPAKFLNLRRNWLKSLEKSGKFDKAWTNRTNDLMAMVSGGTGTGARVVAQGAPSTPDFRILTPQEAQAEGLDPAIKYQKNDKTGQITALGGQNRQAKQIPQQVETKVQPLVDVRDTLTRLSSNFKNDFGGHTLTGGLLNDIQAVANVGPDGMRDWWADWQSMDNQVRNQLFGAALTEHEKKAYESTTISPRMNPAQIKKNIARRLAIVKAATARQQNFLKKNGYDSDAVDALFAPLSNFGGPSNGPVRVNTPADAAKLPSGTLFVTPDGRTMRKK